MKRENHHGQWRQRRKVVHGGTTRLRKPGGPPAPEGADAQPGGTGAPVSMDDGVLRAGKSDRLPTALAEASEHYGRARRSWLPGPLVTTVALLALLFIAVITWFIAQMPRK